VADYGKLIDKQLHRAIGKMQGLTKEVVFHVKQTSFDFGNGRPSTTSIDDPVRQAVVVSDKVKKEVRHRELLVEAVGDLDAYDNVTLEGEVWEIGSLVHHGDAAMIVEVYRG